jgi:cation-transporting P-type ATPase E
VSAIPASRSPLDGLTAAEVAERTKQGMTNAAAAPASRSVGEILRSNVFTLFNALLAVLLVAILAFGQVRDALFGIVLVLNMAIGIVQEMRAKRTLDRLSLLAAPRARVVRDGIPREVAIEAVVLGDVIELRSGDQVVADGAMLSSEGLEVDESLLTGESRPCLKAPGSTVMSGAFCVAGSGRMRATAVGAEAYARKLAAEARRFHRTPSELRRATDRILRVTTLAMVPIAALLIATRWPMSHDVRQLVPETVAALVGMVPQGLVLLTNIAFAVGALRLARRKALVEELPAVEVLARVDIVCLDKTGTLTEPEIEVTGLEVLSGDEQIARGAFGALAGTEPHDGRNATARALAGAFVVPHDWDVQGRVPFSSTRKWSAADFGAQGVWVQGAPDILLPEGHPARERAEAISRSGVRTLLLARCATLPKSTGVPAELEPAAIVSLGERIREDAATTLAYFRQQGVALKVISGDSPATVAAVARRAGLEVLGDPVDAATLPNDPDELAAAMEAHTVFGRVRPDQKRDMVIALQARGHVVAMTGDGVNDTLALKTADIGIAMGTGAPAARAVAEIVLLDGRFASLPGAVAEGRRVMANVERVANLFVTKTVYAALLALGAGLFALNYPLLPRHFTLVDALTIGIPGFFLALAPAAPRYRPGLLARVLRFTLVCGGAMTAASVGAYAWALKAGGPVATLDAVAQARTVAVLVLIFTGLWVLIELSRPLTAGRTALVAAMAAGTALVMAVPFARDFFALPVSPAGATAVVSIATVVAAVAIEVALRLAGWRPAVREEAPAA